MSILSTINDLSKYRDSIPDITDVSELQEVMSACKDLTEAYSYDLKGIPYKFQRWNDYLSNIDFFSTVTDSENTYYDTIIDTVKADSVTEIDTVEEKMREKLAELDSITESASYEYYIGDVPIDYLITPNPSYTASAVSTPIVTDELQDVLNEDVEVNNTTISATIVLSGDDMTDRLNTLIGYLKGKNLIKLIFDDVYSNVVVTSVSPLKDGSINTIRLDISFESLFVASVQTTTITKTPATSVKTSQKSVTSSGKQGTKSVSRQTGTQEF